MIDTLLILSSIAILFNGAFSMLSYRRFHSLNKLETDIIMPLDIRVELLFGLMIGLWGSILS